MAGLAATAARNPTLLDYKNAVGMDGQVQAVIELLEQTNEILQDITFIEGNLTTGHQVAVRTGLPEGTWRQIYGGVPPSKSRRAKVTETCGMLEGYNEVDKALADLNGNTQAFRLSEARAQMMGMGQQMAQTLFYGDVTKNPERFTGFAPRYSDNTNAENKDNIIDAGGTGTDNRSVWLVAWSPETCYGIVPKGSMAGLQVNDKGQVTSETGAADGAGMMEVYRTHFRWDAGLCVADWRYVVRICNIDKSSLLNPSESVGSASDTAFDALPELMFQAIDLLPTEDSGMRLVFYMSRDVRTALRQITARSVNQSTLTQEMVGGVRTTMFQGIPIRRVDRLATDEAQVT